MILTTIVSTGGAGAARGALAAAGELCLNTGGWTAAEDLPNGRRVTAHRQTSSPRMAARLNVQDSDGTLIVSLRPDLADGSPAAYASEAVDRQRRPALNIVLPAGAGSTIPEEMRQAFLAWIAQLKIRTLHVTGPREVDEPGIQQATRDALVWLLEDEVQAPGPGASIDYASAVPGGTAEPAACRHGQPLCEHGQCGSHCSACLTKPWPGDNPEGAKN